MTIFECWLCGTNIYPGHGSLYVKNNSEHYYFCKSKCKKLYKLGKNPSFIRWCAKYRERNGKTIKLQEKINSFEITNNPINIYNNFVLKLMFFLFKRSKKQNVRKNLVYKNINKNNLSK